jgi:hypothetical protein
MTWQWADDGLFLRLAQEFSEGHWLGDYDHLTLVKGPMFPIFIGLTSFTGLPYNLALPTFHFLAVMLFSVVIHRITGSKKLLFFLVLFLLLCPGLFIEMNRVVRNTFYASLFLIYASSLIAMLFVCKSRRSSAVLGFITGILASIVWLTREESIWIIPCSVLLILVAMAQDYLYRDRQADQNRRKVLLGYVYPIGFLLAGFAIIFSLVATLNYAYYGRLVTVEMKDTPFQDAMRALQRVGTVYGIPYVPVPKQARDDIAAHSPSFAKVFPYFTKKSNPAICNMLPTSCGDIAGGWFVWEFRNAAAKAGVYKSAETAAQFYTRVANEVNSACDSGRLECVKWVPPLIPPMTDEQLQKMPERFWHGLRMTLYYRAPKTFKHPPSGSGWKLQEAIALLNRPLMTDEVGNIPASRQTKHRLDLWQRIESSMVHVFKPLITLGCLSFLVTLVFIRRCWQSPIFSIVLFSFGGAVTMLFILVIVDISSFPAVYYQRFPVIHLLVTIACILSIYLVLEIMTDYWRRMRQLPTWFGGWIRWLYDT